MLENGKNLKKSFETETSLKKLKPTLTQTSRFLTYFSFFIYKKIDSG